MSLWVEENLREGDRLYSWLELPMSPEDVEKVKKIYLLADVSVSPPPLVYASYLGLENIVKTFIECAKQTNTNLHTLEQGKFQEFLWLRDGNGRTALDVAIEKNHVDVAKILLKNASLERLISERNYLGQLPVSMLSDPRHDEFIFNILEDAKRRELLDTPTSLSISIDDYKQQGSRPYKNIAMDPHSYPLSHEGDIKNSLDKLELGQLELTPNENTILHLVSKCGDVKSVNNILKDHRSLLYHRNSEGETPTYVAAREGHTDILAIMINHFKKENDIFEPLFIRDEDKHTALHIAIQNHHVGVVFLLIKEIPQLVNCINAFSEIPCYLAAERGFSNILERVFEDCNQRDFTRPDGKTTLHAAAISGSAGCISVVVKLSKGLLYQEDERGCTPLFYAIYHNNSSATAALLEADCSIGYQMLKKNDMTTLPIHFATSHGHCETMKVLISKCPGCLETTYGNGKNILHSSIENKKIEVIEFIFHYDIFTWLINKRDNHGDTPIHSFMKSNLEMMEVVMDPRVDIYALNKENLTPLDVASSDEKRERLLKGIANVRSRGNQKRVLFPEVNSRPDHYEVMHQSLKEAQEEEEEEEKEKEELKMKQFEKEFELYFKIVENLVVVVALIATATFAAAFAVPGGFDGNEGSDQGMPVLLRKAAYKAFVITNTVAFSCSCSVLLGYTWVLIYRLRSVELDQDELEEKIEQRMFIMYVLTGVALITMAIAFVTGIYVVLTPSLALAISLCVISLFIMVSMSVFPRKVLKCLFD